MQDRKVLNINIGDSSEVSIPLPTIYQPNSLQITNAIISTIGHMCQILFAIFLALPPYRFKFCSLSGEVSKVPAAAGGGGVVTSDRPTSPFFSHARCGHSATLTIPALARLPTLRTAHAHTACQRANTHGHQAPQPPATHTHHH